MSLSARYVHKQVDRAIEDVGVIVPGIGEVFYIANPGRASRRRSSRRLPDLSGLPEIQRDYDAFELKLNKRFVGQLAVPRQLHAEPALWQLPRPGQLRRDRARVAERDPPLRRPGHGVRRAASRSTAASTPTGRTSSNCWAAIIPTRTILSGVFRAASGIPITRQVNMISSLPVFYIGRQSDGRTPWLSVFDLSVQQDIPLGGRLRGQVSVNVLNLFDQKESPTFPRGDPGEPADRTSRSSSPASTLRRASTAAHHPRDPRFLQNSMADAARNTVRVQDDLLVSG